MIGDRAEAVSNELPLAHFLLSININEHQYFCVGQSVGRRQGVTDKSLSAPCAVRISAGQRVGLT